PDLIVVPGGRDEAELGVGHRQAKPFTLQLRVRRAGGADEVGAAHLAPDQVVRVVDHAHLVGFGVADAQEGRRLVGRCRRAVRRSRRLAAVDRFRPARPHAHPSPGGIPSFPHSPYGTQMFLTCVAWRRNSSPAPWTGSNQSRRRPCDTQVRFMLPADSRSTAAHPLRGPKYQTPSTSSWAARTSASSSRPPVTMLTTPPGTSDVSRTW